MTRFDYLPGKKKTRARPRPLEFAEQRTLYKWVKIHRNNHPALFNFNATANGEERPKKQDKHGRWYCPSGKRLEESGVSSGYPDVILDVPTPGSQWPNSTGYHGLRIEMKEPNALPSATSPEQKEWIRRLREQGYRAEVCYGWLQAARLICEYLGLDPRKMGE